MSSRPMKLLMLSPLILVGVLLFIALGGWVVMALWNWLLPPLFGWPTIRFWQALALLALCRILFGGFGVHAVRGSRWRRRMGDRWNCMTPEERERFRERMRERFGSSPSGGERTEP
jgi:hypothetical protein